MSQNKFKYIIVVMLLIVITYVVYEIRENEMKKEALAEQIKYAGKLDINLQKRGWKSYD